MHYPQPLWNILVYPLMMMSVSGRHGHNDSSMTIRKYCKLWRNIRQRGWRKCVFVYWCDIDNNATDSTTMSNTLYCLRNSKF
jgi:hypothetical protein